jgi:nicotinamidase/pyrazinamidase
MSQKNCLLIIDVQNDFCEKGSLEVPNSLEIIPIINTLREKKNFDFVILSQDFHPKDHMSFVNNNNGAKVFEKFTMKDGR